MNLIRFFRDGYIVLTGPGKATQPCPNQRTPMVDCPGPTNQLWTGKDCKMKDYKDLVNLTHARLIEMDDLGFCEVIHPCTEHQSVMVKEW
jgi:hypothetical protein